MGVAWVFEMCVFGPFSIKAFWVEPAPSHNDD